MVNAVGAVVIGNRDDGACGVEFAGDEGAQDSVATVPRRGIRPVEATDLIDVGRAAVA